MAKEDEFGRLYEFQQVYDALSNLGKPEFTAMQQILKEAGFTGFAELCDRARMRCYEIDAEYWDNRKAPWEKSAKKSKSTPNFSDMVAKQREKNKGVKKSGYVNDDAENEWLWDVQNYYKVIIPKIEHTAQTLTSIMGKVITYDNNGQFSGSEGHEIQDAIDKMRELLDNLEEKINEPPTW